MIMIPKLGVTLRLYFLLCKPFYIFFSVFDFFKLFLNSSIYSATGANFKLVHSHNFRQKGYKIFASRINIIIIFYDDPLRVYSVTVLRQYSMVCVVMIRKIKSIIFSYHVVAYD